MNISNKNAADRGTENPGRPRGLWLMGGAGLLAAVLVAKLFYWQVLEHQHISLLAARQHRVTFKLPAQRGRILDRNGQLMASDTEVANVVADPSLIPAASRPRIAASLAPLLGMDAGDLMKHLSKPLKFEYLKRRVPRETGDRIDALHLTGIALEADLRRSYLAGTEASGASPSHSLAGNLLGFVNDEGTGQYGLEQRYDD